MLQKSLTTTTNITLSTTRPTRTGYTFAGWATSASGSVSYQPGQTYSANSNVTLYAKWTAITYTVSYNANGGSGAPGNQAKTYGVTLTLSSTKPTRTNYNFKGWGTSSSSTTVAYAAGASYTANASITLYAIWELAYIKPRITNLRADRCNSSGTLIDDGTYALVKFNWSTDRTVSSIKVAGVSVSASGTSGSVSKVVGGSYIEENEYAIAVSVSDSGGTTNGTTTLSAMIFAIDLLKGGKGIAFGQPAKNANLLDSVWPIEAPSFKGQLLTEGDNRTVATSPSDYKSSIRFVGLKQQSVIGLSAGSTYAYVIGLKGWSDQSGGLAHELAFANGGIYARIATSDSAWGSWKKLIYASQMSDLVQIKEQTVATSLTLAAHSGQSISYTPASISGYKFVQMIGGKGNGDVGLMCSAGSTWVFNASTSSKTYSSVSFYLLYVKSSF